MYRRTIGLVFADVGAAKTLRGERINVRIFPYIKKEPVFSCHVIQKNFTGEVNTTDFESRRRIYNVPN